MNGPFARRIDGAMRAACALGPACLAAARVANVANAADDPGVARVLGLTPGPWRALDVFAGSFLAMVPLGTRAERAALASALVLAVAGVTLYALVSALLWACAETRHLRFVVAAIATTAPLVSFPWQSEGAAGGSVIGGLLVLFSLVLIDRAATSGRARSWLGAVASLGLALSYEPLAFVAATSAFAAYVVASPPARRTLRAAWHGSRSRAFVGAFVGGLLPFFLGFSHARLSGASISGALAERGAMRGALGPFLRDEMGPVLLLLAALGLGLAMLVAAARPLAAALVAVIATGGLAAAVGSPLGPARYGAPILAATAAVFALSGVAMQALVRAIASARLPLARASATMVLVLELVLPVDAADDTVTRVKSGAAAASAWDDVVWGGLAPNTLVLADGSRIRARAVAARAQGDLRGDIVVVVTEPRGPLGWNAVASDKALLPLCRDLALTGSPTEASLSSLSSLRPVAMAYEASWGNAVGRHLTPLALFDRFEPEPRGPSDRRRALEASAPDRERLGSRTGHDAELAAASAALLDARAAAAIAAGDRELSARTLLDLRVFAP